MGTSRIKKETQVKKVAFEEVSEVRATQITALTYNNVRFTSDLPVADITGQTCALDEVTFDFSREQPNYDVVPATSSASTAVRRIVPAIPYMRVESGGLFFVPDYDPLKSAIAHFERSMPTQPLQKSNSRHFQIQEHERAIIDAQRHYIEGLRAMCADSIIDEERERMEETEEEFALMMYEERYGDMHVLPFQEPIRAGNSHLARRLD